MEFFLFLTHYCNLNNMLSKSNPPYGYFLCICIWHIWRGEMWGLLFYFQSQSFHFLSRLQFNLQRCFSRTTLTKSLFTFLPPCSELEDTLEENPANVYTKPVVILEDVNHMHFGSGEPPAAVVAKDILSPMSQVLRSHKLRLLLIGIKYSICFWYNWFTKRLYGREWERLSSLHCRMMPKL